MFRLGPQDADLYHDEVMLGSCLWRGYVPAGETYWLRSLFAPLWELAGGCSWKQEDETDATTTSYATTLVASHRPVIPRRPDNAVSLGQWKRPSSQKVSTVSPYASGGNLWTEDFGQNGGLPLSGIGDYAGWDEIYVDVQTTIKGIVQNCQHLPISTGSTNLGEGRGLTRASVLFLKCWSIYGT